MMENVAETTGSVKPKSRQHRSAVSNGNRLFAPETVDGRSVAARRFYDVLHQILEDLGGGEHLSEAQRQLARRAATMSMQCELMEAEAVAGRPFDIYCFGQLSDRLGRCLERIGIERKVRDITPTLQNYLQAKVTPP
jgi:hypothetical protein